MTEKEIQQLLAVKTGAADRQNVSLVLSPDITRNAMRLKKLRHDRMQAMICALAGLIFLAAAAGLAVYLKSAENPEAALRPFLLLMGGGMGLTLLLAPALAWFTGAERRNEA